VSIATDSDQKPDSTPENSFSMLSEVPYWLVSLLIHLVLLLMLANWVVEIPFKTAVMDLLAAPEEEKIIEEEIQVAEEFESTDEIMDEIGAMSESGADFSLSTSPVIAEISNAPSEFEVESKDFSEFRLEEMVEPPSGVQFDKVTVKGSAGHAVTGASGAVDRITHEILMSLEERKTLVVWFFDQSASLIRQREEIHGRFDRIYEQLGLIEEAGNETFTKLGDEPLLTSIVAFGDRVTLRTEKPTNDLAKIKATVREIELDRTGNEKVFSAVYTAAKEYSRFRHRDSKTREPLRNVMFIIVSDETGDDQGRLDDATQICREYEIPVYCIGVPAPFGRLETQVKWVDPDPKFDQSPQWGRVNQGPESLVPERVKLHFSGTSEDKAPIDSGFGPFALTRLCYETGGTYFTVHPNRDTEKPVRRYQTEAFSAYIKYFFDPDLMRRYRPDYVSSDEYWKRVNENEVRRSLVQAAQKSWLSQLDAPQTVFEKLDEAEFQLALSEAQKTAARLEPQIDELFAVLKSGETDRDKETGLRWQAGFDLAMGRVMAVKTRTETYNSMLAKAKRGLKFTNKKNNTWKLEPSDEISVGSQLAKGAKKSSEYLQRVIDQHKGTPWALLAQRELNTPIGWSWKESYTAPPAPPEAMARTTPPTTPPVNNGPAAARDERARMLQRTAPKRPLPKL